MARTSDKQLRERLAAHIRRLMEERGLNQTELAKALALKAKGSAISRLLKAERTMGLDIFARLHTRLGLDANRLLDDALREAAQVVDGRLRDLARRGPPGAEGHACVHCHDAEARRLAMALRERAVSPMPARDV